MSMDDENASDDDPALLSDSLSTESDKSDECVVSKQISVVNFKCVGVTRDPSYQASLKRAFNMLINEKKKVPCSEIKSRTQQCL